MRDMLGQPVRSAPGDPRLAVAVAHLLGLTPLDRPKPCHSYVSGCVCLACVERETRPPDALKPRRIKQPWELESAA